MRSVCHADGFFMPLPSLPVITPIAQHVVPIWNVFYFLKGPAWKRRGQTEGELAGHKRLVTDLVRRVEESARRLYCPAGNEILIGLMTNRNLPTVCIERAVAHVVVSRTNRPAACRGI